jgi:hypothetical protein
MGREVRDHAEFGWTNWPRNGYRRVDLRGRLRDVVGTFWVVGRAMGRETFVQVGRRREVRVMGFRGRSRVRSDQEGEIG